MLATWKSRAISATWAVAISPLAATSRNMMYSTQNTGVASIARGE